MYFPTDRQDPQAITEDTEFMTVVGMVGSVIDRALVETDKPVGAYYLPYDQNPRRGITLAMKTATEPNSFIGSVRRELAQIDQDLPLYNIQTMNERLDGSLVARRSATLLSVSFGAVALLLAAVGIYGVLAYMVAQRAREIGIRLALGSGTQRIMKLILRDGFWILSIGSVLGMGGAVALSRFIESQLFGVQPMDLGVLASVVTILTLVALAACIVPARRATRVDPVMALRHE
jgi:ABC-type lipoprotein release transport system permease subunit